MNSHSETIAAIIEEMRSYPFSWSYPEGIPQMQRDNEGLRAFADRIKAAYRREVAEAKKRRRALWGVVGGNAVCSGCGGDVCLYCDTKTEAEKRVAVFHEEYRYCPYCGAQMESGRRRKTSPANKRR